MAASRRNTLCLDEKVKLIQYVTDSPTAGSRKIAEVFNCGAYAIVRKSRGS